MTDHLLYLSRADVRALAITPRAAREAVLRACRDHAAGLNRSVPKSALTLGPGHAFMAMPAASAGQGIATLKWVATVPVPPGGTLPGTTGLILVSDLATGAPRAVLDGDEITLVRTAALSAAAASRMAPPAPRSIGFVGCGLQARSHLAAFADLFPTLETVLCFSRSRDSAAGLATDAAVLGLSATVTAEADALLAASDIVVSTVPAAPGFRPFLDAARMKPVAFAAAVDLGRSWLPERLPAFDLLATDSLAQSAAPYGADGEPVTTVRFTTDLVQLAAEPGPVASGVRSLFCFRGIALADLALADLVLTAARAAGLGTVLPR